MAQAKRHMHPPLRPPWLSGCCTSTATGAPGPPCLPLCAACGRGRHRSRHPPSPLGCRRLPARSNLPKQPHHHSLLFCIGRRKQANDGGTAVLREGRRAVDIRGLLHMRMSMCRTAAILFVPPPETIWTWLTTRSASEASTKKEKPDKIRHPAHRINTAVAPKQMTHFQAMNWTCLIS